MRSSRARLPCADRIAWRATCASSSRDQRRQQIGERVRRDRQQPAPPRRVRARRRGPLPASSPRGSRGPPRDSATGRARRGTPPCRRGSRSPRSRRAPGSASADRRASRARGTAAPRSAPPDPDPAAGLDRVRRQSRDRRRRAAATARGGGCPASGCSSSARSAGSQLRVCLRLEQAERVADLRRHRRPRASSRSASAAERSSTAERRALGVDPVAMDAVVDRPHVLGAQRARPRRSRCAMRHEVDGRRAAQAEAEAGHHRRSPASRGRGARAPQPSATRLTTMSIAFLSGMRCAGGIGR